MEKPIEQMTIKEMIESNMSTDEILKKITQLIYKRDDNHPEENRPLSDSIE